ncbi:hypothetical protein SDC9_158156 [bioreactor metagenome]|uniref:Uncharacterized protein n=1 Tax=bioreactor metagenome TaxID=1076179 RepID=A0A645FBZ1_9ZZZZ
MHSPTYPPGRYRRPCCAFPRAAGRPRGARANRPGGDRPDSSAPGPPTPRPVRRWSAGAIPGPRRAVHRTHCGCADSCAPSNAHSLGGWTRGSISSADGFCANDCNRVHRTLAAKLAPSQASFRALMPPHGPHERSRPQLTTGAAWGGTAEGRLSGCWGS